MPEKISIVINKVTGLSTSFLSFQTGKEACVLSEGNEWVAQSTIDPVVSKKSVESQ